MYLTVVFLLNPQTTLAVADLACYLLLGRYYLPSVCAEGEKGRREEERKLKIFGRFEQDLNKTYEKVTCFQRTEV